MKPLASAEHFATFDDSAVRRCHLRRRIGGDNFRWNCLVLLDCQRLSGREFTIECRVLGEVSNEHVPTTAGQPCLAGVLGRESHRERVVQPHYLGEPVEHFPVASGVCVASFDDVPPVFAVFPGGVEKLPTVGQCLRERVTELPSSLTVEFLSGSAQFE